MIWTSRHGSTSPRWNGSTDDLHAGAVHVQDQGPPGGPPPDRWHLDTLARLVSDLPRVAPAEARMTKWRNLDPWEAWDEEHDEGLRRMQDALAPRAPETAQERPFGIDVVQDAAPADPLAEVASLTARLRAGDVSVRDRLAALLGRLR